MTFSIHGIPVARGIAIGRAVLVASSRVDVTHYFIPPDQVQEELQRLGAARDAVGWHPAAPRPRKVTPALQAYAAMTTSAARGAIRFPVDSEPNHQLVVLRDLEGDAVTVIPPDRQQPALTNHRK